MFQNRFVLRGHWKHLQQVGTSFYASIKGTEQVQKNAEKSRDQLRDVAIIINVCTINKKKTYFHCLELLWQLLRSIADKFCNLLSLLTSVLLSLFQYRFRGTLNCTLCLSRSISNRLCASFSCRIQICSRSWNASARLCCISMIRAWFSARKFSLSWEFSLLRWRISLSHASTSAKIRHFLNDSCLYWRGPFR